MQTKGLPRIEMSLYKFLRNETSPSEIISTYQSSTPTQFKFVVGVVQIRNGWGTDIAPREGIFEYIGREDNQFIYKEHDAATLNQLPNHLSRKHGSKAHG